MIVSLAQTFLTNCTLLAFVLVGFAYVLTSHTLQGSALVATTILLILAIVAAALASLLLLHPRLRRRTLFWIAQTAYWVLHRMLPHRAPPRTHIWRYQFNLNRGIAFLLSRKRAMLAPLVYITLDWFLTIMILYTSFLTVRYWVEFAEVIVGFAVGIVLSFASLIPGGLGVMEGSMAAVFASMGDPVRDRRRRRAAVSRRLLPAAAVDQPVLPARHVRAGHDAQQGARRAARRRRAGGAIAHCGSLRLRRLTAGQRRAPALRVVVSWC